MRIGQNLWLSLPKIPTKRQTFWTMREMQKSYVAPPLYRVHWFQIPWQSLKVRGRNRHTSRQKKTKRLSKQQPRFALSLIWLCVTIRRRCRLEVQDLNQDRSQLSSPRRHSTATRQEHSMVEPPAPHSLLLSPLPHPSTSTLAMLPTLANPTTKHCK